ncbi:MAG: polyketide synthase, partial [Isosphaeraceae bacterium]
ATAQLNHLVASLFAQGVPIDPTYLFARRRPERVDLDATTTTTHQPMSHLEIGFPELKLSEAVIAQLRQRHQPTAKSEHAFPAAWIDAASEAGRAAPTSSTAGNGAADLDGHATLFSQWLSDRESVRPDSDVVPAHVAAADALEQDQAMLDFLETKNGFLTTQREVMEAYLRGTAGPTLETTLSEGEPDHGASTSRTGPQPGPWVGVVKEWEAGQRIVTTLSLDPSGNPVAENHTLGGRRVSALAPERKGLPVVPFTVMAEMVAQVGAMIAPPGLVLDCLRDVHAHRWVQFETNARLELRGARDATDPRRVRVTLHHYRERAASVATEGRLVYEGTACFTDRPAEPIASTPLVLDQPRPSKLTAEQLYDEQWLFHGPPMQALTEVGPVSPDGLSGTIAVLPLGELLRPGQPSTFHTNPIVLDTFTHLLGCWGLDCLSQGDVIFPLRMGRLALFGDAPPVGTPIACRIQVVEIERRFVRVDAELVRPDGLVWMQIRDWQDWRFYWPARYRDVFRAPDTIFVGEELPLRNINARDAVAIWLAPPADMGRPVWRDVLEQIQLTPEERAELTRPVVSELGRKHRLWGRIAAKEAVRRLWLAEGQPPRYPADLAIANDPSGRPRFRDLAQPHAADLPAVSIAHAEGIVVALAAHDPQSHPGIDIESIREHDQKSNGFALSPGENELLRSCTGPQRQEHSARLRAARQAAAKASGMGPRAQISDIEVIAFETDTADAIVTVSKAPAWAASNPIGWTIRVHTERRGEHIWAWTLGKRVEQR